MPGLSAGISVNDAKKKYTTVKRRTIGKVVEDDPTRMRPNEIFKKFFPEVEVPEQREDAARSSCLRSDTFMAIREVIKEYGLDKKLDEVFDPKQRGLIRIRMVRIVSDENNSRRISKPELKSRINELEKRLGFIENYITEKGLYDEALEYVEEAMKAYEELPFE